MPCPNQHTIDQELERLTQYRRELAHYLEQQAALGTYGAQFEITEGIRRCRARIEETKALLRSWNISFTSTRLSQHVNAPRASVYRAILDAGAVAKWMVPSGMTSYVHVFEAREGGSFRISLTYNAPTGTGKTTAHTDTYRGRFVKLVPNEQVVEVMEFETDDDSMRGEMTATFTLIEADGGTDVLAVHDNLPPGIAPDDNETGWRMALEKLARLVETGPQI
jgi:uncharacterized protein YndB with AHSA1/START domain